ncbi:unnamed protein product [Strongylus vulgaris]|uniref:SAM domain-containing protein n=1 Tax=Strongylus vulgaris TaxID=40348 RepID=A0A3P7K0A8_STRVU|nr:unnamed protein product [Strongylus vulgaris]
MSAWRGAPWRSTYPPMNNGIVSRNSNNSSPTKNHKIVANHVMDGHMSRATEELVSWLRTLDVDDHSIRLIVAEQYTKQDLFEFVTRKELLNLGVA